MSIIVDRFKEISKELEDVGVGTSGADYLSIIAAILTAGEAAGDLLEEPDDDEDLVPARTPDVEFTGDDPTAEDTLGAINSLERFNPTDFDDGDPQFDPPVLKGKHPVSLLQEVCQERMLNMPEYEFERLPTEAHLARYRGTVTIKDVGSSELPEGRNYGSHGDTKRALALVMLVEHFGAKNTRRARA